MAGYLPQMEMLDMSVPLQAYAAGDKLGQEESQRNILRDVGRTASTQGYDAASKVALSRGDVSTGVKLGELSMDRQTKMYDFLGRAAVAADTPEKWGQYIGILSKQFGPESVKGFENFSARESAILLSKNAFDTLQQRKAVEGFRNVLTGGQPQAAASPGAPAGAPAAPGAAPQIDATVPIGSSRAATADPASAISSIESGGRYDRIGPLITSGQMAGQRAMGKYQVMESNIGPWTKQYFGQELTPQQFLKNPQAQDAVFQGEFGRLSAAHGQEGAARAWFAGEGGMNDPGRKDQLGTTVAQYGQKFTNAMGGQTGGQPNAQGSGYSGKVLQLIGAAYDPNLPKPYQEIAGKLLEHALKDSDTPEDIKKYHYAVSQGFRGNYEAWTALPDQRKFAADELKTPEDLKKYNFARSQGYPGTFQQWNGEGDRLKARLDDDKLPNDIKEYKFAVSQGEKRNFTDWDINRKREASTHVSQINKGEDAADKEMGTRFGKKYGEYVDAGDKAFSELGTLATMRQLAKDPNFQSGILSERLVLPVKQLQVALGGDPKAAASMETFRSLANKSVLDTMGGSLGTGVSNADRDFIVGQVPTLGNTPEGNSKLFDIMEKVSRRKIDIARLSQDYAQAKGEDGKVRGKLDAGFDRFLSEWRERNPLFSEAERAEIKQVSEASLPKPGDEVDGWIYKGGDRSKRENYERKK